MFAARNMMFAGMRAFDPLSLSPALWLDASDASTLYDAPTGGSLVTTGNAVARWEDKSGNAQHALQGTPGSCPTRQNSVQNGLGSIRFDGTNDGLRVVDSGFVDLNVFSIFAVVKTNARSSSKSVLNKGNYTSAAGTNYELVITTASSGSWSAGIAQTTTFRSVATANTTNTTLLGMLRSTDAGARLYVNESLTGTTTAISGALNNVSADLGVGCRGFGAIGAVDSLGGDIFEILIFQSALSDANRQAVEAYLNAKWAIY